MPSPRSSFRNVGASTFGFFVNVVVGLWLTRYVVARLGEAGYGVWSLVVCFVGYYGLFDVGVRSAVSHYVATYNARKDLALVNRTLSTAMALMLAVAAIAALVTWFAGDRLPDFYRWLNEVKAAAGEKPVDLSQALRSPEQLRTVVWIMGAGFALSFPMALYTTVIYSVNRIVFQQSIAIAQVVIRGVLTWWVLRAGHGLVGLACVAVGCNLVVWVPSMFVAHRVLPGLSFAFRHVSKPSARELFSYGGFNVLVNLGDTVLLYTSGFVIFQALRDASAVAYYAVPATTLIPYFMTFVQSITWTFTPSFTARWATGQVEEVRRLYDSGTRGVLLLASLIAGGFLFLGGGFLEVWQEPKFSAPGTMFPESVRVLQVLAVATLVRASQSTGRQVLFAMREVRYLGLLVLAEAAVNVALSIYLVRRLGLVGVAYGTLIPVCVTQGIVQPTHLIRELGMDWRRYAWDLVRGTLPVLLVMAGMDRWLGDRLAVTSWLTFLERGFVIATPALLVGFFCATDRGERRALLLRLFPARVRA
jgi:O-antigen/teichoic acid export membrane protein